MSMEDLMRAFARETGVEPEPKPPALIVEALRDQATYFARRNPFSIVDVITPRAGTDVRSHGEPHIVIALKEDPTPVFVGEPSSNAFGQRIDLRVLSWKRGHYTTHWVESAAFEAWVDPAAKADDAPASDAPAATSEAA